MKKPPPPARAEDRAGISKLLAGMARLHDITTNLTCQRDLNSLLDAVLTAGLEIGRAEMGFIQLIQGPSSQRIEAHSGLTPTLVDLFSGCDEPGRTAIAAGKRVSIPDISACTEFNGDSSIAIMRRAGIFAIQSVPFLNRFRKPIAVLSALYRSPRDPEESDRLLDMLAPGAAELIDRLQMEEAIKRVAMFPEQNPSPVMRISREGKVLFVNHPCIRMLKAWKWRPDEALPEEIQRQVREALNSGNVAEAEIASDSTVYSLLIAPIKSKDYANVYGRDITKRKQMQKQLHYLNQRLEEEVQRQTRELWDTISRLEDEAVRREEAERELHVRSQILEGFFQHTITPLLFIDSDFSFLRVNEAFARVSGKGQDFFPGRNYFDLYPDAENQSIFRRVVRTRQPYRAYAKPFDFGIDARQVVTYWNWWLTPLLDNSGGVRFLVLNLEDVTERQQAFSELENRAQQLHRLTLELLEAEDSERKRLAEILHDDLQQILSGAKFHLATLANRPSPDWSQQEIVSRLDRMLSDAIAKSRSLSHELSPPALSHGTLAKAFRELADQMKAKHGLTVAIAVRDEVDSESSTIKTFLYNAARELCFNVTKHSGVNEAAIRLRRIGRYLCLSVSDRGRGFDPAHLKTGFGYLKMLERVEMLSGRIKILSEEGEGTVCRIIVSDSESPKERVGTEPVRPRHAIPETPQLRILLVDDHDVMRKGLASLLRDQADLDIVAEANNGREAIVIAEQLHPDIVIMDFSMPVMSGEEATRRIKMTLPDIKVIALSMFESEDVKQKMRNAGADAYVSKSAPPEDLLVTIRGKQPGLSYVI